MKKIKLRSKLDPSVVLPEAEVALDDAHWWGLWFAPGGSFATVPKSGWEPVPPPLPTEPGTIFKADETRCVGGCAYCVGAGGYEDHDGTWQVCSGCHGAPCNETCLCPEPIDNTEEHR